MFTYRDYYDLVTQITNGAKLYLRHDVDISLKKAVELAERERTMGIGPAVYYILHSSSFYNPFSRESKDYIDQILDLGHKIGLHYDLSLMPNDDMRRAELITTEAMDLGNEFDVTVTGISCHEPTLGVKPSQVLLVALRAAGYNDPSLTLADYKYISDSGMNFREDPAEAIKFNNQVHLNIHPEWWSTKEGTFQERLHDLELDLIMDRKINKHIKQIIHYRDVIKNEKTTT